MAKGSEEMWPLARLCEEILDCKAAVLSARARISVRHIPERTCYTYRYNIIIQ
jgi:hypothetical protein